MAVTEHGEITIRWKRSRWVPRASATTALIGSAWETATMVAPGWRDRKRATADVTRHCISGNDSPLGNRNPLGQLCTPRHSGSLRSALSSPPVHSPKSHATSPRSTVTLRPRRLAIGSDVSFAYSRGEACAAALVAALAGGALVLSAAA